MKAYSIDRRNIGHAVIVNNVHTEEHVQGTWKDVDDLSEVYRRIGFQVRVENDLSKRVSVNIVTNVMHISQGFKWLALFFKVWFDFPKH